MTLTLRHNSRQALADTWGALRHGWSRSVVTGRAYAREREQFGIVGWTAVVEVTHGESGWHPHLHVLVFFDTPVSTEMVEELGGMWWERFERGIGRKGYTAIAERGGLDVRRVALDGSGALGVYLQKVAMEVTGGSLKDGRHGNRSPFAILRDGLATGLADDLELWWQWEAASHGRRQLTWSRGLRAWAALGDERTDEEIAEDDHGSDDLIALPPTTWEAVRDQAEQLLTAAELRGLDGACAWLDSRGLAWHRVSPRPRIPTGVPWSPDDGPAPW